MKVLQISSLISPSFSFANRQLSEGVIPLSGNERTKPVIYIRSSIPEEYRQKMKELNVELIVEPWKYGEPEPEPVADISRCNVVLTSGIRDSLTILDKAPNIEWVHSFSVGVEKLLENERVRKRGIIITNSRGCTSVPIAEHTIALIAAMARGIDKIIRNQIDKVWGKIPVIDLEDAIVGIIGYGDIGREIAKRCKALGIKVYGVRRHPDKSRGTDEPADAVFGLDEVDFVLRQADFLVLSLPLTKETYHFLDEKKIARMKKGSRLINVGRGNTVVEKDLLAALENGHLGGAALDVFETEPLPQNHPFWTMENVIVSPHHAYWSPKNKRRNLELFLRNLLHFMEGKPLINVVDKELGY